MIIGINCGHTVSGQPGSGAVGYLGESDETRRVGRSLMALLRRAGHTVYDCTNDYAHTTSENLAEIVRMANSKPLDLFVSIHFNSGGGKGSEVFTNKGKSFSEAENVCRELSKLGFVNRGIKDGSSLYVIRHTTAKAMLVEVCFVDTKTDADLYNRVGSDKTAQAICAAICGGDTEDLSMNKNSTPMIYDYIDDNMPAWARPTIQKLKDEGYLLGDEHGRLGLTMEMIRMFVVMDKAKLFN